MYVEAMDGQGPFPVHLGMVQGFSVPFCCSNYLDRALEIEEDPLSEKERITLWRNMEPEEKIEQERGRVSSTRTFVEQASTSHLNFWCVSVYPLKDILAQD